MKNFLLAFLVCFEAFGAVVNPPSGGGSGGSSTNASGTAGHLAKFNGTNSLRDSIVTQQGETNITVPGTLSVNGILIRASGNDTNDLSIAIGANDPGNGATNTGNVAIGSGALTDLTTGNSNIAIGKNAGASLTTGIDNTLVGTSSGGGTSSSMNTAIGKRALSASTTSSNNVAIGAGASSGSIAGSGAGITTGVGNIVAGYASGGITTGARNILIGDSLTASSASASNTLDIANAIFGTGLEGTGTTLSTGKIGILTNAPGYTLDVSGTVGVSGATTHRAAVTMPSLVVTNVGSFGSVTSTTNVTTALLSSGGSGLLNITAGDILYLRANGGLISFDNSSGTRKFTFDNTGLVQFVAGGSYLGTLLKPWSGIHADTNGFHSYNLNTDASNYAEGFFNSDAAGMHLGHRAAGTGGWLPVDIRTGGGVAVTIATNKSVTFTSSVAIGSGTPIVKTLSATATLDFGSILAAQSADLTITVTGAAVGDAVTPGLPAAPDASTVFNMFVSSANTVTVRCFNVGTIAVDPASATYRAVVTGF